MFYNKYNVADLRLIFHMLRWVHVNKHTVLKQLIRIKDYHALSIPRGFTAVTRGINVGFHSYCSLYNEHSILTRTSRQPQHTKQLTCPWGLWMMFIKSIRCITCRLLHCFIQHAFSVVDEHGRLGLHMYGFNIYVSTFENEYIHFEVHLYIQKCTCIYVYIGYINKSGHLNMNV